MEKTCTEHKAHIQHYETHKELAEAIGNLRYDSLIELFDELSKKFERDAIADGKRGRKLLSEKLHAVSFGFAVIKINMQKTWKICKRYME